MLANEVDLFISKVAPDKFALSVYVNDKFSCTIAYAFTMDALVEFINFNEEDIRSTYGDFDVIINPNVYVS